MTTQDELVAEAHRLSRDLGNAMALAPVAQEVPLRLHSREIDGGGAPEFHPAFLRYLGNASVCHCGRPQRCAPNCHFAKDRVLGHLPECEPACISDTRFHASNRHNSPNRMKKALRQVRRLNPAAYDFTYMIVALGYAFEAAAEKLNLDNIGRGKPPRSLAEYAVLWVSGASLLSAAFQVSLLDFPTWRRRHPEYDGVSRQLAYIAYSIWLALYLNGLRKTP